MPRHILTREERQRGFRNAVLKVQIEHNLGFNINAMQKKGVG
jgi:hypothetical protein